MVGGGGGRERAGSGLRQGMGCGRGYRLRTGGGSRVDPEISSSCIMGIWVGYGQG